MPRIPQEGLIPRGDRLLVQAFPKLAKRLENNVDELDKADKELLVKLLPGAIERSTIDSAPTNNLPESIEAAISQIVTVVKLTSFAPSNAPTVESASQFETETPRVEAEGTAGGVIGAELPNGSDTSQDVKSNSLSRNELAEMPGNSGDPGRQQERQQNARVRTASRLTGRAAAKRAQRAPGETAKDRG